MSGAISSSLIGTYLAIAKHEAAQVAVQEKGDATTQQAVTKLRAVAPTVTSPAGLLNNYSALEVVLGATGLSSAIGETGLLKDLLTQDPTAKTSLVHTSANLQYAAFAAAMQNVPSVQFQLGRLSDLSVTTSGATATAFTVQNTAFNSDPTRTSSTNVGRQWTFVMNDGGADASIAAVLNSATGNSYGYSVTNGTVTVPGGAPAVTTTTDASGNKVYTVATATDSTGAATTQVRVVSVGVTAATGQGATAQTQAVATAMNNAGLDASLAGDGTLTVSGASLDRTGLPVYSTTVASGTAAGSATLALGAGAAHLTAGQMILDGTTLIGQVSTVDANGTVTLVSPTGAAVAAGDAITVYNGLAIAAQAQSATDTSSKVVALGASGLYVIPGQVLRDGATVLGTVASVDTSGNVTLTADAASAVQAGDVISVISGASMQHAGIVATADRDTQAGSTTLNVGAQASQFARGQTLWDGGLIVGTVQSIDSLGVVTLSAPSAAPVASGDTLVAVPPVAGVTTPALSDHNNLTKIIDQYETNQFEAAEGKQNLGMQQALYYTRNIASVTSIDALMADPTLLSVVEANLGLPSSFGQLSYDQQHATLTARVKLSDFQNASYVTTSAERYLTLVQEFNPASGTQATGVLSLFQTSGTSLVLPGVALSGNSNTTTPSAADTIMAALYPDSTSTALPATSGTLPSDTGILSLFA